MHELNRAFLSLGGYMSRGVYDVGDKCPGGKCPGGKCPEGKCPGGKCPGVCVLGGKCPSGK